MLLSMSFYTSKAQNCITFSGNYNLNNWKGNAVDPHTIQNDVPHGNYLQLKDDSGPSYEANDVEFNGNWLTKAVDGCLCFDYNVDWSTGGATTLPVKAPKLNIYYNTGNIANILTGSRAAFVGNSSNPDLQNNTWRNFCLPVGLSSGTNLPSNSYGTWLVYNGNTVLTGTAASTAWDVLIQNVTGIALMTDYNSYPGELVRFDNFCWTCATLPCSIALSTTINPETCSDKSGSIDIIPAGGVAPYTYIWNTGATTASIINLAAGNYTVTVTDKNNCTKTMTITIINNPCPPNPCCKNSFPFWTDIAVPESYPFSEGTYSVEDFLVKGANTIPITELKVTVEDFELISKYDDCLKCYNSPATLGSILGGITIGTGSNKLTLETQPYGNGNQLAANINEVIWKNPSGVTLNTTDFIRLIYILPGKSEIPCCVDSAKVCIRFSYRDINGGYCEVYNCTIVPLRSKGTNTLPTLQQLFQNSRGVFNPSKAPGF